MLLLALAVVSTLSTQPPVTIARCEHEADTISFDQCLGRERDKAMHTLERYRIAARAKLIGENPETTTLPAAFDAAQATWLEYQKHQCDAVYTQWQGGTIRGAMSLSCEIRMIELRTHELWSTWILHINDDTPPVLPEPVVERGS